MTIPSLRAAAPDVVRTTGRRLAVRLGEASAAYRPLPDFLVVGAQRCGSPSLFRALLSHPDIRRPNLHKGVNYFDLSYDRGERWYRAHFPVRTHARQRIFDASGYYLFHPLAAGRIVRDLPETRVIVLVRDPVERAYSAYKHELARGFETTRSFVEALELEDRRLEGEEQRMVRDPSYQSFSHRHHAYRRRGEYAHQLAPYLLGLGPARVLIVESERFFTRPEEEYARVTDFLDVRPHQPASFDRWNARPGGGLPDVARDRLRRHFERHDALLESLLGHPPAWRTAAP